ncbi:MAG: enoyl-CoA hydratase/isomerase family protein [Deltaproteobacteria bacterium]|jgi:enoyl-CoA hydratase/carnithine racemase
MKIPVFNTLEVSVDGSRGALTLNRPEHLNPLSPETLAELTAAADFLAACEGLKVVVVSGKGRAFSAGADVAAFAAVAEGQSAPNPRALADLGRLMAEAVEGIVAVTVARIQGHCVGGAVVLASACDLRVAADDVRFVIPEIDLGIPLTWGGIPRLVREIGPALTKELVMTCRPFTAAEAHAAGFINRVVAPDQLDREVEALAAELADKPALALLSTKRQVNAVTQASAGLAHSWADADGQLAGLRDPEGRASALRYLERLRSRRSR